MALSGYSKRYSDRRNGGIQTLALIRVSDFQSATYEPATHEFTAITLQQGAHFIKYDFREDEAEYQETIAITQGAVVVTHELKFLLDKMGNIPSGVIDELIGHSYGGLIAVLRTFNQDVFLVGYSPELGKERPLRVGAVHATTGKRFRDATGETVTLLSEDAAKARTFSGDFDALLG